MRERSVDRFALPRRVGAAGRAGFDARGGRRSRDAVTPGRAVASDPPGSPQRPPAHHPGSPRRRRRRRLPLRRRGRALRAPGSARLLPLPGAHALQGHGQVGAGLHRPRGRGRRRPHECDDIVRLHRLLHRGAGRRAGHGHADARGHGVPLDVRSQGSRARARGDLRGGEHRGGQSEERRHPAALRPRLRR